MLAHCWLTHPEALGKITDAAFLFIHHGNHRQPGCVPEDFKKLSSIRNLHFNLFHFHPPFYIRKHLCRCDYYISVWLYSQYWFRSEERRVGVESGCRWERS